MRVLLVHATPLEFPGGAEISLRHHLEHRPPNVEAVVVEPGSDVELAGFDVVVLANLRPSGGVGEAGEYAFARQWAERLKSYPGRVVRSERDSHPCGHRDARCVSLPSLERLPCDCSGRIARAFATLYEVCDSVQVLSPLHGEVIDLLAPFQGPRRVIAAPVDFERFKCTTPPGERAARALVLADHNRVADDVDLAIRAHGLEPWRMPYHSIAHERMPDILNQCRAVVVMPRMFHAFGRIVVEAMACGCQVIANPRVGALSFDDPVAASRRANREFWHFVLDREVTI